MGSLLPFPCFPDLPFPSLTLRLHHPACSSSVRVVSDTAHPATRPQSSGPNQASRRRPVEQQTPGSTDRGNDERQVQVEIEIGSGEEGGVDESKERPCWQLVVEDLHPMLREMLYVMGSTKLSSVQELSIELERFPAQEIGG